MGKDRKRYTKMTRKENKQAAYYLDKAKDEMDRAVQEFEKKGQYREAETLYKMILKLEEWEVKHC